MPGQHGNKRVTMLNLKVAKVLDEENLVLVDGIPGPKHGMIAIRAAVKKKQKSAKGRGSLSAATSSIAFWLPRQARRSSRTLGI